MLQNPEISSTRYEVREDRTLGGCRKWGISGWELADFDPSDKKFVAVAIACSENPSILQATDCKWIKWAPSLKEKGIEVKFLCPDYVKANYEKKSKRK
jgi:hypothetical protein